jgi:5-hydroxyisourate hydrolase
MTVSTHVLDTMAGRPASGMSVSLSRLVVTGSLGGEEWEPVAAGETDADGRHRFGGPAGAGVYQLTFGSGGYFALLGVPAFYPFVTVTFEVSDPDGHYHVPLLLSPFGYSTYRGS